MSEEQERATVAGGKRLKERTREFALRTVRLYAVLPKSTVAQVLGKQLLRAGTSVGAHYREGTRSRSDAEFVSKLEGALQELEESRYWFELLEAERLVPEASLTPLVREADELAAMLVASVRTVKARGTAKR
ncbi:MAG: four helix bundle protein [candidate division WOR-3 bacterium]|nr:four helix bundle protein [candidate division WOR-3 bacterium]